MRARGSLIRSARNIEWSSEQAIHKGLSSRATPVGRRRELSSRFSARFIDRHKQLAFPARTAQGHMFLIRDNGLEGFVAFGNQTNIFCGRPCIVEEMAPSGEPNLLMCGSQWDGRKHMCSARFWPTRSYIVQARRHR
jgi:hypothetical protein